MVDSDVGLDINVTEVESDSNSKKKKNRFYGNKNFRHQNREKYLGKAGRPTVINTDNFKVHDGRKKAKHLESEADSSHEVSKSSTALHFSAVGEVPEPKLRKSKPRSQGHQAKRVSTKTEDIAVETNTDKAGRTGAKFGPWKSSLFNQNPEIPKVVQPQIQSIQEEVFSRKEFSDLPIHPHLLSYINEKLELTNMTAIQQNTIPILLSNRDAMVKSQTGSGKTLAYAVPVVQQLQKIEPVITRKDGPVALVLVPTRELALQSYEIFSKLTTPFCRIVSTWIIGGENRKSEKSRIRKGVNILIGTPGRILDHIQTTKSLSLGKLRWLIFDEADRLLDMGFQKQVDIILKAVNEQSSCKLQTVLLSATLSEKVECLANVALKDPVHVHASNTHGLCSKEEDDDEGFALPRNLIQHVAVVPSKLRLVSLATLLKAKLLQDSKKNKIIVFLSCRDSVEFHFQLLKQVLRRPKIDSTLHLPFDVDLEETEVDDSHVYELHGGMSQAQRQDVFLKFSACDYGVMLTTDVAARGLDLPSVKWVIQYTSPGNPVDYIHRVGRTARAGKKGNALLLLTPSECKYISLLTQFNIAVKETSVDDILTSGMGLRSKSKQNQDFWQRAVEQSKSDATSLQNSIEAYVAGKVKIKTLARTAYMSFIRAYASYPTELKSIFHVKHLHLGHVAKSFGLRDAPSDVVKMLQKSVSHLPIKTSFEYREAKKEAAAAKEETETASEDKSFAAKPRMSRKQLMKSKMSRKPDLMSEFSSGLSKSSVSSKKPKLAE